MPEKIKKGDFVEIEYTGTIKDSNIIFDTTNEDIAKKEGFFSEKHRYGPVIVCIGQNQLLKGLDNFMEGKDVGAEYEVLVMPEDGFGKKDAKNMKLVPTKIFTKQKINPMPGLPVNIDGIYGVIITVAGGRTIVDFNHPLAGKELIYKCKANKIIKDSSEKLSSFLTSEFGLKKEDFEISIKEGKAVVKTEKLNLPEEIKKLIEKKVSEIIPEIKSLEFAKEKKDEKTAKENTNI